MRCRLNFGQFCTLAAATVAAVACTDRKPVAAPDAKGGSPDTAAAAPACPPDQLTATGACCPADLVWSAADATCATAGPAECLTTPAGRACKPRWCSDAVKGEVCAADGAGCARTPRPCTAAESAKGQGCGAGEWPQSDGTCRAAGTWGATAEQLAQPATDTDADPPALPAPPPFVLPANLPQPVTPKPLETAFAVGADGLPFQPVVADAACLAGAAPPAPTCFLTHPAWICPPGFEVDPTTAPPPVGLSPCRAAPADCPKLAYAVQPGPGVTFVDAAAAATGADGSAQKPWPTLDAAVAAVAADGTIALAAGTYALAQPIAKSLKLAGVCAAKVTIGGTGPAALEVAADASPIAVSVSGVKLAGTQRGLLATGPVQLAMSKVWIDHAHRIGAKLGGFGLVAQFTDVVIAGTQTDSEGIGRGIALDNAAQLSVQRVRVATTVGVGIAAVGFETTLTAQELVVDGGVAGGDTKGQGIIIQGGAKFAGKLLRVTGNTAWGLTAIGAGSEVTATGALIDATQPTADGDLGLGAAVSTGARLQFDGAVFANNCKAGIVGDGFGSLLVARGLVVADTLLDGSNTFGVGVYMRGGASALGRGWWLMRNHTVGMSIADAGTTVALQHLAIVDTKPSPVPTQNSGGLAVLLGGQLQLRYATLQGNHGIGLGVSGASLVNAQDIAVVATSIQAKIGVQAVGVQIAAESSLAPQVNLENVAVIGSQGAGLTATGVGTAVSVHGLTIADCGPPVVPDKPIDGVALYVAVGAKVSLWDARLSHNRMAAVFALQGGQLLAKRLIIDGTLPDEVTGRLGIGIGVGSGGSALLQAGRISGNRTAGVLVQDAGSQVELRDVLIDATGAAADTGALGIGVGATTGAMATLTGGRLWANHREGAIVQGQGSSLDMVGVLVDATQPELGSASSGVGVSARANALRLGLTACRVVGNVGAAVYAEQSALELTGCAVGATAVSTVARLNAAGAVVGNIDLADGIVARGAPAVTLVRCAIAGNRRAGLFLDQVALATVSHCVIRDGFFGVVAQHESKVVENGNRLTGLQQARATDVALQVLEPPKLAEFGTDGGKKP